jgi:hypothetical protein
MKRLLVSLTLLSLLSAAPSQAAGSYPIYGINFYAPGAENTIKNSRGMYSLEMIYANQYTSSQRSRIQNIVNAGFKVILRLDYDVGLTVPANWDWNGRYNMAMKARQIALDLGDLVEVFVIGNEPLDPGSGKPEALWYSYVFNAYDTNSVYDKIKEVRPSAKVSIFAPNGWPSTEMMSYFDSVLNSVDRDGSGYPLIDAFALHAYSGGSTSSDTRTEDPRFADRNNFGVFKVYARKIYERYGMSVKPIYITETNTYWFFGAWATDSRHSEVSYRDDWMKEAFQAIDEFNKSNDQKIDALLWYTYNHCGVGCADQYQNSLVRTDNARLNRARQDLSWSTLNTNITPGFAGSTLRFQAENYSNSDTGNGMGTTNGVSGTDYLDKTAGNTGGQYRAESVDVGMLPTWDGFFVGWTDAGEWLRYETLAGGYNYQLRFRYARGAAGTSAVRVVIDGTTRGGTTYLPATANWDTYSVYTNTATFNLPKGFHDVKLMFDTGGVNIDYFELVRI